MADDNDKLKDSLRKLVEEITPDVPGVTVPADAVGTPPPSAIPDAGEAAGADAEKAAMVEQAKSRVAAVKESLAEKAAAQPGAVTPGTPKPPVKKKEEGPKPVDASGNNLVKKLKAQFDGAVIDAFEFLGQVSIRIDAARIVEVCDFLLRSLPDEPRSAS